MLACGQPAGRARRSSGAAPRDSPSPRITADAAGPRKPWIVFTTLLCAAVPGGLLAQSLGAPQPALNHEELLQVIQASLDEDKAVDPVTIIGGSVALAMGAVVASAVPAARAANVPPVLALRSE